tara:strand:- start:2069 stop:2695 length:627 start_codon:yes stop_codon:yes gene_type:complete
MEKPNYYAILSAEVRYDNNLRPNTKLLYAEITALSNITGECFASNRYFSNLYNKSKGAISGWISELVKYGYIQVRYTYKEGTKEIEHRYIKILKGGVNEKDIPPLKKTLKNNTIKSNNKITNTIIQRKSQFESKVALLDYDVKLKREFCDYWTEKNSKGTKMKFEMERTFDIKRRLSRWYKNENKWNKQNMGKLHSQINAWQEAKKLL